MNICHILPNFRYTHILMTKNTHAIRYGDDKGMLEWSCGSGGDGKGSKKYCFATVKCYKPINYLEDDSGSESH